MPQKSPGDLWYLITDRLSHYAGEALAKAIASRYSDEIALAAIEVPWRIDTDYNKPGEEEVRLSRFILRH